MSSRRSRLEAAAFRRRQAIAAFTVGPGADVDRLRRRPNRPLYAGTALAVVLCAVAGGHGFLTGGPPKGWLASGSVVVDKDYGGRYLVRGGTLRPVANQTSLLLLTNGAPKQPVSVRHADISTHRVGAPLGLATLPDFPPRLAADGGRWAACADRRGALDVVPTPADPGPSLGGGVLVRDRGRAYLVTGTAGYPLSSPAVLRALGYDARQLQPAPVGWLRLLHLGPALHPLPLAAPPKRAAGRIPVNRIVTDRELGTVYVGTAAGLRPVLNRTSALLLSSVAPPVVLPHTTVTGLRKGAPYGIAGVPDAPPKVPTAGVPALACVSSVGRPTSVTRALPLPTGAVPAATLVPARAHVTAYAVPGSGVLVRPPAPKNDPISAAHPAFLVADGAAYPVPSTEALRDLRYDERDVDPLAAGWVALLPVGPALRPLPAR